MDRRYGRGVVAAIGALVAAIALTAPVAARPSAPGFVAGGSVRAVTGACQAVGGGPSTPAGPQRATVVIDTGTGPVWSACVSFSGTISGTEALARAQSVISDLNPVYDLYAGEGRAVCRLRGVGTDPPDCLGKSVDYWSYFRNGAYARGGAGTSTVHDGDTEGWRFGHGRAGPRPSTQGTQAVVALPPTPPPPTTPPVVPPTSPGPAASVVPSATAGPDGPPGPVPGPTVPGATTTAPPGATTSSTGAGSSSSTSRLGANGTADPGGGMVVAGAASPPTSPPTPSSGGGSSSSAIGFVAALSAVGAVGFVVRRRRRPSSV